MDRHHPDVARSTTCIDAPACAPSTAGLHGAATSPAAGDTPRTHRVCGAVDCTTSWVLQPTCWPSILGPAIPGVDVQHHDAEPAQQTQVLPPTCLLLLVFFHMFLPRGIPLLVQLLSVIVPCSLLLPLVILNWRLFSILIMCWSSRTY